MFNCSFWKYFYPVSKCFESTVHWKALVVQLCCRTGISLTIVKLRKYLCWWMLYFFQTSLLVALFLLMNWKQDIFQVSPKHTIYNIHQIQTKYTCQALCICTLFYIIRSTACFSSDWAIIREIHFKGLYMVCEYSSWLKSATHVYFM